MAVNKFYVVWEGRTRGIFSSWSECRKQVEGFAGAKYKGFADKAAAEKAFKSNYWAAASPARKHTHSGTLASPRPVYHYLAVDAACAGNPGLMEYRGVSSVTGEEVFHSMVYQHGTNNIGEFLAIVHGLAWQQKHKLNIPIYSDSVNAIKWVKSGKANTKLVENSQNQILFEHLSRAEDWLQNNKVDVQLLKWDTKNWGEIPADFGRK